MKGAVLGLVAMVVMVVVALVASNRLTFWFDVEVHKSDRAQMAEAFNVEEDSISPWSSLVLEHHGLDVAWSRDSQGRPRLLLVGPGYDSDEAFTSEWAVEASWYRTANGMAVAGVTIPDAASVSFGDRRGDVRVSTEPMPGDPTKRVFAWHFDAAEADAIMLKPTSIVARDAQDRLLGRQHPGGHGRSNGLYDRRLR
ncbi:hypothetical protein OM076_00950 [Solirubrobacter ginsenosidimutans]|uniref:Uncharacterized protein n=1 Tax=Solirubrobacter ginsenosidimutans TaxID=490573 RepID=A0A9X3MNE2_9ACTN|nr:hypothetical protein [Solirubrobacter ginsenosidimutans]MDA0158816.1 hypothetical protein [Solirubrobacter ginsenosidimutans]